MKNDNIFGVQAVKEALRSEQNIQKVLVRAGSQGQSIQEIIREAREKGIPLQYVPDEKLAKITDQNHQGIIAIISPVAYQDIEDIIIHITESKLIPLIVVLDGITDVRNFGAIVRTAECAGCHAVLIPESGGASITPDAIKASAGALNHLPICRYKHIKDIIVLLKQYGISVIAATEKTQETLYEYDFTMPIALILGAEGFGVSDAALKTADKLLSIPMYGKLESLNVSVSASLFIYEALRQRMI
jgi:23S rRNA (guanosine2251-2'-O)-methyltransferase